MRNLKRVFILFYTLMILILITTIAFAAETMPVDTSDSSITWEILGTMSGATAAVLLIVQFIKAPLDKIWKIPTRAVVYGFAVVILICVEIFSKGTLPLGRLILIFLNAIVITMAAMGTYETTFRKIENKQKETPD